MTNDNLSEKDKILFRQAMKDVTPLNQAKVIESNLPKTSPAKISFRKNPIIPPNTPSFPSLSDYYFTEVEPNTVLSYCSVNLSKLRFHQLKKGTIPWQAKLDLHGLNSASAKTCLLNFLSQQSMQDHRCILIIHGKGSLNGEAPILKNLVNHWLQQLPQVLAFHSAQPQHGGTGALYLLLKKNR